MTTAIVSDLHLGTATRRDLLRHDEPRAALLALLRDVDELVLLGDVLELRDAPVRSVLDAALPVLAEIDGAMAGRRVTLLGGNHDHRLVAPLVESARMAGRQLEPETIAAPDGDGPVAAVAAAFSRSELRLAYPGVWVRDDVYATHGHYLDVHNTMPTIERLAAGAVQRVTGPVPTGSATPDDYETALAPLYALAYAMAQAVRARPGVMRQDLSLKAWQALSADGSRTLGQRLLGNFGLPAAVRLLNAAGLGPLSADLSTAELRRSSVTAMEEVMRRLGIDAAHVVFGHTHRSGPHPGDVHFGRLVNSGSWIHEPAFLGTTPTESPYWPGHCVLVGPSGPPELRRLLDRLPAGV